MLNGGKCLHRGQNIEVKAGVKTSFFESQDKNWIIKIKLYTVRPHYLWPQTVVYIVYFSVYSVLQ